MVKRQSEWSLQSIAGHNTKLTAATTWTHRTQEAIVTLSSSRGNNLTTRYVQQLLRRFYLTILLCVIRSKAPDQRLNAENVLTTAVFKVRGGRTQIYDLKDKQQYHWEEKRKSREVEVRVLQTKQKVQKRRHQTLWVGGSGQSVEIRLNLLYIFHLEGMKSKRYTLNNFSLF